MRISSLKLFYSYCRGWICGTYMWQCCMCLGVPNLVVVCWLMSVVDILCSVLMCNGVDKTRVTYTCSIFHLHAPVVSVEKYIGY